MNDGPFVVSRSPTMTWEDLTANERAWIEFIRVISVGHDPRITPERIRRLRELLDAG
jgi:hypothetical protein